MVGWHHHLSGHEFEQTLGDGEGQGSLTWGHKELDTSEQLNNSSNKTTTWGWNQTSFESELRVMLGFLSFRMHD